MNATIFFIIYMSVIVICSIALIVTSTKQAKARDKFLSETKELFDNELYPLCKNANTLEECDNARKVLNEKCIKDTKFIIHSKYIDDFYSIRCYLLGKEAILKK